MSKIFQSKKAECWLNEKSATLTVKKASFMLQANFTIHFLFRLADGVFRHSQSLIANKETAIQSKKLNLRHNEHILSRWQAVLKVKYDKRMSAWVISFCVFNNCWPSKKKSSLYTT